MIEYSPRSSGTSCSCSDDLVLAAPESGATSVGMRADGETLQVVGGAMHADDHVNRLRRDPRSGCGART